MKFKRPLDSERIVDLAWQLSRGDLPQQSELRFSREDLFRTYLLHTRGACKATAVARRLMAATIAGRMKDERRLLTAQRILVKLAADEDSLIEDVFAALVTTAQYTEEHLLGRCATAKQKVALRAIDDPEVHARYSRLVREGAVSDTETGLAMPLAKRRRLASVLLGVGTAVWMLVMLFAMLSIGPIDIWNLVGYLLMTTVMSVWLGRGQLSEVRDDENAVSAASAGLGPKFLRHLRNDKTRLDHRP